MNVKEDLDKIIKKNQQKLLDDLRVYRDKIIKEVKMPEYLARELDDLYEKTKRDEFTIASGVHEFNDQFNVEKIGNDWKLSMFSTHCTERGFRWEKEVDVVLEDCKEDLESGLTLLDAVLKGKDRDKWGIE